MSAVAIKGIIINVLCVLNMIFVRYCDNNDIDVGPARPVAIQYNIFTQNFQTLQIGIAEIHSRMSSIFGNILISNVEYIFAVAYHQCSW